MGGEGKSLHEALMEIFNVTVGDSEKKVSTSTARPEGGRLAGRTGTVQQQLAQENKLEVRVDSERRCWQSPGTQAARALDRQLNNFTTKPK